MEKAVLNEEIASLMQEMYMLLHAGISVGDALSLLSQEDDYRGILEGMAKKADEGASLAECFRENGGFPSYVCGLIEVGERAGRTEEALLALSRYYEKRVKLNRRICSALLYPAIMLILMLIVIGVLLVKVLPIFNDVYASLGEQLSGIAGGLLTLGRWIDKAMPIIWVILLIAVVFFAVFSVSYKFRSKITDFLKKTRGDKGIMRQINTARITQAMAMCLLSGMQIEEAIDLAVELTEDTPEAKKRCLICREAMDNGKTLSEAMKISGVLPDKECRLLELGQKSGSIDITMEKISENMTENSEIAIDTTVSRIEPALVMACSLLVGLILLSVVLPLMHIMSAIG